MQTLTLFLIPVFLSLFAVASAADLTHIPDKDFDTLKAAGNIAPTGIWSDGKTMWVTDSSDDKIYAYDGLAAASNQATERDQGIQDFSMKIKGARENLEICVRDHDCEDGDKIRVDVDGRTIFSGEIDNKWDC